MQHDGWDHATGGRPLPGCYAAFRSLRTLYGPRCRVGRALRSVLDVPARSLARAMADQEEARLAPSRTLALLPLPPAARAPATHAVLAIIFDRLSIAGHAGFVEPNREPTATDSERRHAISGDRIRS
jgi:hypothetical protein